MDLNKIEFLTQGREQIPNPAFGREADFNEVVIQLQERIEPVLRNIRFQATAGWCQEQIREVMDGFKAAGRRIKLFDDVYLTDFTLTMDREQCKLKTERIKTESMIPGAIRWKGQNPNSAYLGQVAEYDVYIGYQGGLPPTIVLRYGNEPEDNATFKSDFQGFADADSEVRQIYLEAHKRYARVSGLITISF